MIEATNQRCGATVASGNRCEEPCLLASPYCARHTVDAMRLAERERDAARSFNSDWAQAAADALAECDRLRADLDKAVAVAHEFDRRMVAAQKERDEARASDADHVDRINGLLPKYAAVRAALDECEGGIRSYLAHAGQDADHSFIVGKYLNPARRAWVSGGISAAHLADALDAVIPLARKGVVHTDQCLVGMSLLGCVCEFDEREKPILAAVAALKKARGE